MKIDLRIEIVVSTQSGLMSPMGQKSREVILSVLAKHYTDVRITIVNDLTDLKALVARAPDLVFLGMKLMLSDQELGLKDPAKIWVTQFLDQHGIAYTGSNQAAHELEINKVLAKQRITEAGLSTSRFQVVDKMEWQSVDDLDLIFPVFIKPTSSGGGKGIDSNSVVQNQKQLNSKIQTIANIYGSDSLIEEYLPGREFSVSIIKDEITNKYTAMPIELVAPLNQKGDRILSQQVKSSDSEVALRVIDETIENKVVTLALNAFWALGARDYGRIDIRMDAVGNPHFLEANLLPSLISGYGSFPKACAMILNLDHEQMILRITRLGLARVYSPVMSVTDYWKYPSLEPVAQKLMF